MFFCPMKIVSSGQSLWKDSISELLPDPATPAITVSTPSGSFAVTFFRLCSEVGPSSNQPVGRRRFSLKGLFLLSIRPVRLSEASSPS